MNAFATEYLEVLRALHRDFIATYQDLPTEALDWVPGADMNSFCVLVVHTTGSARFWIGIAVGDPPDRDRDAEFQSRGLSIAQLQSHFSKLETYAEQALIAFSLDTLGQVYPVPNQGERRVTAAWALMHALEHTGLHLGHAQITRQLWQRR